LVHGAWHNATCWDGVAAELLMHGRDVTAVQLPFEGFASDVAAARRAIEKAGDQVVVVGHSYGGEVISAAASGATNVARLIYVAAFMIESADEMAEVMVGSPLMDALITEGDMTRVDPENAGFIFYGDSDLETAERLTSELRPMKLDGVTADGEPAWRTIPASYLICTDDRALLPAAQRRMAERAEEVWEWETDHSPFVTRPKELAELITKY
ncbi:MAG TPA: alpha/beta hydrolase, partial [Acidimicrobiales bacterium]|nr:alpha/beta hydrolase [Acidimicrobiales bacterium]